MPRLSVTAGYYRRQFYNLQIIDNQNVAASDWNSFAIATPTDTQAADLRPADPDVQPEPQQDRRRDRQPVYVLDRE